MTLAERFPEAPPQALALLEADRELYFERVLKIRTKQEKITPLKVNPAQKRFFAAIDLERRAGRAPRLVVLKSRRLGVSTGSLAEMFRGAHFGENNDSLIVAHRIESARFLFEIVKRFQDRLPAKLRIKPRFSTRFMLSYLHDTSLRVEVAGEGAGRGFEASKILFSEFAFYPNAKDTLAAALQAVPDTPESLVVVESTPNGVGNEFHKLYVDGKNGKNGFVALFFPWFEDPTYRRRAVPLESLDERERVMMERYSLDLEQVAWYRYTLATKCNGDQRIMDQEYGCNDKDTFLASGSPVFEEPGLRYYEGLVPPAVPEDSPHLVKKEFVPAGAPGKFNIVIAPTGRLRIYRDPVPRHRYLAGIDISEGDSLSDISPIVILDQMTLNTDAVWYGRTPPELLAREAVNLGWYYNEAQLIPEVNANGLLFNYEALRLGYINFYYRRTTIDSISGKVTDKIGMYTTAANRMHPFNCVREYVRKQAGLMQDPDIYEEWIGLRYTDDARRRVDHPSGGFSDGTLALGMCLIVHKEDPDAELAPLSLIDQDRAVMLHREMVARESMGHSTADLKGQMALELTADELQRLDDAKAARQRIRERSGTGGEA